MWKDGLLETRDRKIFLNLIMRNILYGYKKFVFLRMQKFMNVSIIDMSYCWPDVKLAIVVLTWVGIDPSATLEFCFEV